MYPSVRTALPVFLTTLLLACSSSGSSPQNHAFQIIEENGIPVALTTGGPIYTEPLFRYAVETVLEQNSDQPESLLSGQGSISIGSDGSYFVADTRECRIIVFNQDGRFLRSFGGRGQGPGEFLYRMDLQDHSDGVLTLWDYSLMRMTWFNEAGQLLDANHVSSSWIRDLEVYHLADGSIVMLSSSPFATGDSDFSYQWQRAVVTSSSGDTLTDFRTEPIPFDFVFPFVTDESSTVGGVYMWFSGRGVIRILRDAGLLVSTNGWTPEIMIRELSGETVRIIRLDLEPESITRSIQEQIRAEHASMYPGELDNPYVKAELDALRFHDRKAFWNNMEIDQSGWIWLRVGEFGSEIEEGGGHLYRVLSPDGEYMGNSRRPGGWGELVGRGMYTIITTDPETEEPVATIYRIVPAVPGLTYP